MSKLALLLVTGLFAFLLSGCASKPEQISIQDPLNLEASLSDILKDEYGLYASKDLEISSVKDFNKLNLILFGETEPNTDVRLGTLGMDKTDKFLFKKIIYLQISDNMSNPNKEKPCATSKENLTIDGKSMTCERAIYSKGANYSSVIENYIDGSNEACVYFMEKKFASKFASKLNELVLEESIETDEAAKQKEEELMKQKADDSNQNTQEAPPPPGNASNTDDPSKAYTIVDEMPEFPGGQESLMKFIADNIQYPVAAKENGISGKVFVQFVVLSDGKIGEITILRSVDPLLDNEAIRVIKKFPLWKPGKQNGKPVNVQYSIPVNFKLE